MGSMNIVLKGLFAGVVLVGFCGFYTPYWTILILTHRHIDHIGFKSLEIKKLYDLCAYVLKNVQQYGVDPGAARLIPDSMTNRNARFFGEIQELALQSTGTLQITIIPQFDGASLILNNQQYRTQNGDSLYIDLLRFYLSAIKMQGKNNACFVEQDSYHLFDAEEPGSHTMILNNVPAGRYDSLCFFVGTDSLTNVSGVMGGDLDPTKGMYWAWNSGYINVKLEGRSKSCQTRHNVFEFHIGGYMPPHQTVRRVVLPLKPLEIKGSEVTSVRLIVDLGKFFSQIRLAETNSLMIPSKQATQLADWFTGTFMLN
jgi:hypothetical protein